MVCEMLCEKKSSDGFGILLVDARNAFNSVNRVTALWNVWSQCSCFLFNTYQAFSSLLVQGSDEPVFSQECVTQGDPLAMFLYALAVLPLIQSLSDRSCWFLMTLPVAMATLSELREWFYKLREKGPAFGYFPVPAKSVLVVEDQFKEEVWILFGELEVMIVSGHRFLGGYIGDTSDCEAYAKEKVQSWVHGVEQLSKAAESQPQAAFAALSKSVQCEWRFLQ